MLYTKASLYIFAIAYAICLIWVFADIFFNVYTIDFLPELGGWIGMMFFYIKGYRDENELS